MGESESFQLSRKFGVEIRCFKVRLVGRVMKMELVPARFSAIGLGDFKKVILIEQESSLKAEAIVLIPSRKI
jgi:hypothetical protein